ncbi:hypothetical protein [Sphingobium subterraneum]|uniref:Mlr4354 like protein n=1 Tax=Sphingobium subterraneum TaxID=627688 RepID=A0A841J1S7_9SPHN|nr:hypothetical protein [Sphingobium subterraneum]MBB6124777.1 hypothetical protein [Sphingobium subterraneum]
MKAVPLFLIVLLVPVGSASARDSLGVFDRWAAFRDASVPRCYAIAAPAQASTSAAWRPFASVGTWPRKGVRGQIHIRLSRQRAPNTQTTLSIGDRRFALVAGNADAWAPDKRADAAILAAMRSAKSMSVAATGRDGRGFADTYTLRGAATAMDAAAIGCAGG